MLIKGGNGLAFILNEFTEWVHSVWLHCDWIGSLLQIMHVSLKLTISQKLLLSRRHIYWVQSRISRFAVYTQSFQLNMTNQPSPGTGKARENMNFRGWKMKVIGFMKMNVLLLLFVDVLGVFELPIGKSFHILSLAISNSTLEHNPPQWEYLMVEKSYFKSKYAPSCSEYRGPFLCQITF